MLRKWCCMHPLGDLIGLFVVITGTENKQKKYDLPCDCPSGCVLCY